MTILLVNLFEKMDLVSKNITKRGKRLILGGGL